MPLVFPRLNLCCPRECGLCCARPLLVPGFNRQHGMGLSPLWRPPPYASCQILNSPFMSRDRGLRWSLQCSTTVPVLVDKSSAQAENLRCRPGKHPTPKFHWRHG
jgi:hypothetical protein